MTDGDYGCHESRGKVSVCAPGIGYLPSYWFSRYPARLAPTWNILKVFDPISWILLFLSILFSMLMKPVYETPIDTAQDILDRGLTVIYLRESESIQEIEKNSASYITRQLAERGIVPKVIFCSGYRNIIVITFFKGL